MQAEPQPKDVADLQEIYGPQQLLEMVNGNVIPMEARPPRIRFFQPSELRAYRPDHATALVGDSHIMRGEVFVIGGEPGVGKSRSATALAVAGATAHDWFGLTVHRQFRTMIVQTENGRHRLQQEFSSLRCEELDPWIRVSEPPPFGLTLSNPEFQQDIKAALDDFKPECVILDPWNAVTRDDKQRDYADAFEALRNLLPTGPDKPALGIVAHTRKPAAKEKRTGGTGLMHILSGSHMLSSVPRSVFVMVRGSEEESDDSVVWCNPKNNNGSLVVPSAWFRRDGHFEHFADFDWQEFEKPQEKRKSVSLEDLEKVFANGDLELRDAASALADLVGISSGAAYNALAEHGRFARNLIREGKKLSLRS